MAGKVHSSRPEVHGKRPVSPESLRSLRSMHSTSHKAPLLWQPVPELSLDNFPTDKTDKKATPVSLHSLWSRGSGSSPKSKFP